MALKNDQTPCLALRDQFAPTNKLVKKEEDMHLSRTSNWLVIRPPAAVSCTALFPNTNKSLPVLCSVTYA